jgi:hypothetical protein
MESFGQIGVMGIEQEIKTSEYQPIASSEVWGDTVFFVPFSFVFIYNMLVGA